MLNKPNTIDSYWWKNSPAFSNQYYTIWDIPLSPVGVFLNLRYKKISQILNNIRGNIVLDIGCGSGVFMQKLIADNRYPIGIDYSAQMLNFI